jgi:1-acyl-sn-glycerol-3-phosphate acyltransferase
MAGKRTVKHGPALRYPVMAGSPLFWLFLKYVLLGPALRLLFRPRATGLEHIPAGGAVLAANHVSFLDPMLLPLMVPRRRVLFLTKVKYIDNPLLYWILRGAGVIPVPSASALAARYAAADSGAPGSTPADSGPADSSPAASGHPGSGSASDGDTEAGSAVVAAVAALRAGRLVGIFPEGTRSPDGLLHQGKTGAARIAVAAGVPVIPAGITGTDQALPRGAKVPRPGHVRITFGPPISLAPGTSAHDATGQIMAAIAALSGQQSTT